jgi:isoleucyl-tRNA synthetase
VHQAPGFGEDDYRVCLREKIIEKWELPCPVDDNGFFTERVRRVMLVLLGFWFGVLVFWCLVSLDRSCS